MAQIHHLDSPQSFPDYPELADLFQALRKLVDKVDAAKFVVNGAVHRFLLEHNFQPEDYKLRERDLRTLLELGVFSVVVETSQGYWLLPFILEDRKVFQASFIYHRQSKDRSTES